VSRTTAWMSCDFRAVGISLGGLAPGWQSVDPVPV